MNEILFLSDKERLHIVESLGESVGKLWKNLQRRYTQKGEFYVSSPLSSTPIPVYQWIIAHAEEFSNWERVRFILMDEQLEGNIPSFSYVSEDDPASYERFAKEKLLLPLSVRTKVQGPLLKPNLGKPEEFNNLIEKHGGIDLLILAIGARGHYAQVMPGTPLETGFHVARLIPEFIEAHTKAAGPYAGATFREYGMSLGPQQVLTAKNIAVIISGQSKKQLTRELFSYNSFTPDFPLSIVHHPSVRNKIEFYVTEDIVK